MDNVDRADSVRKAPKKSAGRKVPRRPSARHPKPLSDRADLEARPPMLTPAIARFVAGVLAGLADEVSDGSGSEAMTALGLREAAAACGFDFVIDAAARAAQARGVPHIEIMIALYEAARAVVAPRSLGSMDATSIMLLGLKAQRDGDGDALERARDEADALRRALAWQQLELIDAIGDPHHEPALDVRDTVRHLGTLLPAAWRVERLSELARAFELGLLDLPANSAALESVGKTGPERRPVV